MSAYTVKGHSVKRDNIQGKQGGTFKVLLLTLANDQGTERQVEWFTRQDTSPPEIGSKLEGEVTKDEKYKTLKFKKGGGGFGGGGRGPSRDGPSIEAQVSAKIAGEVVAGGHAPVGQLRAIATEAFRVIQDLKAGKTAAPAPGFEPKSDVPVDTEGLDEPTGEQPAGEDLPPF